MEKFSILKGTVAPLPIINVDTDKIIPKQFLKTIKRTGLGKNLFYELKYDLQGNLKNDFVLNSSPYNEAKILVTGKNFGCGSSREHAPWALLDFGFKCIIASSFADIFYNNCFKNGILPIKIKQELVDELIKDAESKRELTIDLEKQTIVRFNNDKISFDIDPFRKKCLLEGLDDIDLTMEKKEQIDSFEKNLKQKRSWLFS